MGNCPGLGYTNNKPFVHATAAPLEQFVHPYPLWF